MSSDQPEQTEIDVRNNPESRAAAAEAITRIARASDGGACFACLSWYRTGAYSDGGGGVASATGRESALTAERGRD